jgi:hypothetical protein
MVKCFQCFSLKSSIVGSCSVYFTRGCYYKDIAVYLAGCTGSTGTYLLHSLVHSLAVLDPLLSESPVVLYALERSMKQMV